jgi:hypothetical protein
MPSQMLIKPVIIFIIVITFLYINGSDGQSSGLRSLADIAKELINKLTGAGISGETAEHYYLKIVPSNVNILRGHKLRVDCYINTSACKHENCHQTVDFKQLIPYFLENFTDCVNCTVESNSHELKLKYHADPSQIIFDKDNPFKYGFNATISTSAPNASVSLLDQNPFSPQSGDRIYHINAEKINIMDNIPIIESINITSPDEVYIDTQIIFSTKAYDLENLNQLTYEWYENDSLIISGNTSLLKATLSPGYHGDFLLVVGDSDNYKVKAPYYKQIYVNPLPRIKAWENYVKNIRMSFLLTILIILFILTVFKGRLAQWSWARNVVSLSILSYSIIYLIFGKIVLTLGIIELFILSLIMPIAGYFIISCFSFCTNSDWLNQGILNSLIKSIENIFKTYKNKNLRVYLKFIFKKDAREWSIWYVSMLAMILILCALIQVLPPASSDLNINLHEHIWLYYSMMTQTFGAILAIVAIAAIEIKKSKYYSNSKYLNMRLRNFAALYGTIIILSIFGMAMREPPNLEPYESAINSSNLISLIIFEVTLLLSIPAIVCLCKFILDLPIFKDDR